MNAFSEGWRRRVQALRGPVRAQLVSGGIPASKVDEVTDLALFAASQAVETVERIVFASPDKVVSITALGVALGVAKALLEDAEKAMITAGKEVGMKVGKVTVSAETASG